MSDPHGDHLKPKLKLIAIGLAPIGIISIGVVPMGSGKIVKSLTESTTMQVLAVLKGIPEAYTLSSDECR